MTRAFLYLTLRSIRNRIVFQIRRAKNPRYALALIIGIGYFYLVFWRNPRHAGHEDVFPLLSNGGHVIALGGLLFGALAMWMFGGDSTALAFTQAEASFLFPAPVSRRQLVGYKLVRGQLPLLFNTLIWVLLLNAGRAELPAWARFIGLWALFVTIFLHRLGASLVRTAWAEHGSQGVRRNWLSYAVFAVIVVGVGVSLWRNLDALRGAADMSARMAVLVGVVTQAPARYVLWPFNALVGPVFATSLSAWAAALPPMLLVLLVHIWWVMHTDTAFEEAALAATADRARKLAALQSRRTVGGGTGSPTAKPRRAGKVAVGSGRFALAPTGRPEVAIVWKNLVCLRRTTQLKQFLSPLLLAVVGGIAIGSQTGSLLGAVMMGFLVLAGVLVLMGPLMLRGDLRQDLQHLSELKMLPFSGMRIVAAEVLSVSIPLATLQVLALAAAAGLAQATHVNWGPPAMRIAIVVGAVPALFAFNVTSVTVQNGSPILFPGWSRLGTVVPGGVEMMGQMILVMGFYLLLLTALLVVPVATGFVAIASLKLTGAPAVAAAMLAGSAVLAFELQGVLQLLGAAFEKLEPNSVGG